MTSAFIPLHRRTIVRKKFPAFCFAFNQCTIYMKHIKVVLTLVENLSIMLNFHCTIQRHECDRKKADVLQINRRVEPIQTNTKKIRLITVQLFWEGHKSLVQSTKGFDIALERLHQTFVAFSEKLNFKYK